MMDRIKQIFNLLTEVVGGDSTRIFLALPNILILGFCVFVMSGMITTSGAQQVLCMLFAMSALLIYNGIVALVREETRIWGRYVQGISAMLLGLVYVVLGVGILIFVFNL